MKDESDEAIISMSVAGEVTDTSIIEVGRSRPQFQYTREELMEIRNLPLSKRRPDYLDLVYNNSRGVWDPERWYLDRKRSETPPEDEKTGRGGVGDQIAENHNNKRRSGDPRERIRKEQDGIVLSPQRRSFNSGCFVNVSQPASRRPESPINKTEVSHRDPPVRRIGSGRILNCDMWDFRSDMDKIDSDRSEYNFRPGGGNQRESRDNRDSRDRERDRDRDTGHERERRIMRRDFIEKFCEKKYSSSNNDRRRTYSEKEAEEPEWFSSGPTSQHDTIELKGFEDAEERGSSNTKGKKQSPNRRRKRQHLSFRSTAVEKETEKSADNASGSKGRSTPTSIDSVINVAIAPHSPISEKNEKEEDEIQESLKEKANSNTTPSSFAEPNSGEITDSTTIKNHENDPPDFNLDDFLKSDTFPGVHGLLSNGVGTNNGSGSRFSQWFKRESPVQFENNKGSIQDELLNNLLNDISEPNIQIPSVTESNTYFAPISPANTTNHNAVPSATGFKLLEMLQRGNKPQQNGQTENMNNVVSMMKNNTIKEFGFGKMMHNLEELEARMRGGVPPAMNESHKQNKTEEDLSAFKKLLAQVNGGQAVPAANGSNLQKQSQQPVTLMQLLNLHMKNQQPPIQQAEQQPHATTFNHIGPLGPVQHPHQSQMQHENLMKVLHIQQQQQQQHKQRHQQQSEMLSMMVGGQRMIGMSPPIPPDVQMMINNAPSTQNLLQRPEAQAIIHGLQQGEITKQHLIQQIQNPAMQHRHREVLMNILKVYGGAASRTISPHPNVSTPQDHLYQQMLYQQQRIPSPMNNVPSSRELAAHTQSIIQSALIKKKLEEQRENFRKRQEHQQQQQQVHQRISSPVNAASKQTLSPPPLAFTPTSVLRKMTADKEPEGNSDPSKMLNPNQASHMQMQSNVQIMSQGVISRHASMRQQHQSSSQQHQSQQQTGQTSWPNATVKQHSGRPIVKGGSNSQFNQYSNNNMVLDFGSQVQRMNCGPYGNPSRSKHSMPATSVQAHSNVPQYNISPNTVMQQRPNQMNSQIKSQVQHNLASLQQMQQRNTKQPTIVLNQNYNSSRTEQMFPDGRAHRSQQLNIGVGRQTPPGLGFMGNNGGDLSPTSNQLARWFSPELLAQARAGKLPELGQTNMISLEELERLQHASTVND